MADTPPTKPPEDKPPAPRPARPLELGEQEARAAAQEEQKHRAAEQARERVRHLQDKALARLAEQRDHSGRHMADLSAIAIRSPGIAAAAGIAAILGYVSTNFERLEPQIADYSQIISLFLACLLISVVVSGTTYLSQMAYFYSLKDPTPLEVEPWAKGGKHQNLLGGIGAALHAINILLMGLSYVVLGCAFLQFFNAFSTPAMTITDQPPGVESSEPIVASSEPSISVSSAESNVEPSSSAAP